MFIIHILCESMRAPPRELPINYIALKRYMKKLNVLLGVAEVPQKIEEAAEKREPLEKPKKSGEATMEISIVKK